MWKTLYYQIKEMLNTRYGIILIIMSILIEMLTCNSGLYRCYHVIRGYIVYIYLFSIPGFLYIYKSLFFNLIYLTGFKIKCFLEREDSVDGEDRY